MSHRLPNLDLTGKHVATNLSSTVYSIYIDVCCSFFLVLAVIIVVAGVREHRGYRINQITDVMCGGKERIRTRIITLENETEFSPHFLFFFPFP